MPVRRPADERRNLPMISWNFGGKEYFEMSDTNHLIVTVHGIRTYGNWQRELDELLKAAEPGVTVLRYQYGSRRWPS